MEIRTLRYFLAVAREENMTRAAEALHVTQPTLSKALKSLEDELGKKLFTRHSFSIKLTDEGILLPLNRFIRVSDITSPAGTRSRSWKNWTRDFWILWFWWKRRMRANMNFWSFRKMTCGGLLCRRMTCWQRKRTSVSMT